MSRRLKLVLGLVILQAMAMLSVLGATYVASQDMLLRFSEGFAQRVARDATAFTEGFLDPAQENVQITHRLLETGILSADDIPALRRYFLEVLAVREEFDGIYVGLETGAFIYASRSAAEAPGAFRFKDIQTEPARRVTLDWYTDQLRRVDSAEDPADTYDPRTRPWYEAALARDAAIWTKPYVFFTSQQPGITTAVPVHNSIGTAATGAVGIDIKITRLSGFLESLDISPRGQAAIVSEDGEIIAHSLPDLVGGADFQRIDAGGDPILTAAATRIEGGFDTLFPGEIRLARFEAEGEVWLGAVERLELDRTPWTVVTYMPEADLLAPLTRVRHIAVVIALAALAGTALLGYIYGRRVMG